MPSKETARQHRALAQDQYKHGQYMQAMQSADKALALGFLDLSVYDIKAAALNKLVEPGDGPWRDLGFETIKLMCQKWPKNWRPLYRKAEHLRSRGAYTHALTAITSSFQYADDDSRDLIQRKETEIQGLREIAKIEQERRILLASREEKHILSQKRRIEAKRTKDYTHLLPPDILNLVVDLLIEDDPNAALKIAGVRKTWREEMLSRRAVWQKLVVGARNPLDKARIFSERNGGKFIALELLESFPKKHEKPLADLLTGRVANMKSFVYTRYPQDLIQGLNGQFDSIEEIVQSPMRNATFNLGIQPYIGPLHSDIDQGLALTRPTLKHLSLSGGRVTFAADKTPLNDLQTFRMNDGVLSTPGSSLISVAQRHPDLVTFALDGVMYRSTTHPFEDDRVGMEKLVTFSVTNTSIDLSMRTNPIAEFFANVSTPELRHLDLWNSHFNFSALMLDPALAPPLSNLRSLDVGKLVIEKIAFFAILRQMPNLRFLNVSCTSLGDTFLQEITRDRQPTSGEAPVEELLPNLIGLSIAALNITSVALRDMVISRIPKAVKARSSQSTQTQPAKLSAFRPSSMTAIPTNTARRGLLDDNLQSGTTPGLKQTSFLQKQALNPSICQPGSSASNSRTSSNQAVPRSSTQDNLTPKSSQPPFRRYLQWLCLDHCETIDPQLIEYLRTKILFVSAGKTQDEDRIRGKNQYHWDLDYYDSCVTDDPMEKCKLVAIPGTRDGYEIHHTCGKYNHQDAEPEEDTENIWESQWNPSSSQDGELDETLLIEKGKGKEMLETQSDSSSQGVKRSSESMAGSSSGMKKAKGKGRITVGPDGLLGGF